MLHLNHSDFKNDVIFSFILSGILVVLCICIVLFVPEKETDADSIYAEGSDSEVPYSTALEIAGTVNYLCEYDEFLNSMSGTNTLYIQDYLNMINPAVSDKGLEYYRNPQTRGAVEWFFIRITGRRDIASAILTAANRENIPLTLAFALAYTESRYKPSARNTNVNGSIDRGLFQLNDRSFPQLTESDFLDPNISARYGMRHLRYCIGVGKDDYTGVAMYNAGVGRIKAGQTPASTKAYVKNIKRYRAILDAEFKKEVINLFEGNDDTF